MKVAAGAKAYLEDLLKLEDQVTLQLSESSSVFSGQLLSITGVVRYLLSKSSPTAENPLTLYITGDSLGGTAAVLSGTYLFQWLKTLDLAPGSVRLRISVTNAAALYNDAFVQFYNGMLDDAVLPVAQQFNRLEYDIVSNYYAFNLSRLPQGIVNASSWLEYRVKWFIVNPVTDYLRLTGQTYAQIGLAERNTITTIHNTADPRTFNLPQRLSTFEDLIHYYEFNHFSGSLLTSLGAPPVPCPPGGCIGLEQ